MREYYEQLWAHTSDEVDQTTKTLPKETENLYRQMSIKETESLTTFQEIKYHMVIPVKFMKH